MSNKRNDGGPAFPLSSPAAEWEPLKDDVPAHWRPADGIGGMTLRDYFAAKAMQGYISRSNWTPSNSEALSKLGFDGLISRYAYECADAMLKEREA